MKLIEPKEIILEDSKFIISKIPAWEGFDIMLRLPLSALPKIGEYEKFRETVLEIISYTGKSLENMPDGVLRFTERQIINNHFKHPESVFQLCLKMIEYNYSFFQDGRVLNFFKDFAQNLPQWISKILADFLAQFLPQDKLNSTN